MTIKYSASAGGFFDTTLHRDIPADAVSVTSARHSALLIGQANGHEIVADARGRPQLRALAPVTVESARTACVQAIKREAARRINERMPLWRQINALRDNADPGFHQIDTIRAASGLIEDHVSEIIDIGALQAFDVVACPLWPSFEMSEIDS